MATILPWSQFVYGFVHKGVFIDAVLNIEDIWLILMW